MTNSRRAFFGKAAAVTAAAAVSPLASFGSGLETAVEQQSLLSMPTDLRITSVEIGYYRGLNVKLRTNQDIYGVGEGVDAVNGTYYVAENIGRRLANPNTNPLNVNRLFEEIRRSAHFGGGQSGMFVAVLSAFETALWDLAGKALGLPVYQLLGGKFRDRLRAYVDTTFYTMGFPTPQDFYDSTVETLKQNPGLSALKYDVDFAQDPDKWDRYNWSASPGELDRMYDQIAAARDAAGPKIGILVDMHGRFDYTAAQAIAKRYEKLNLTYLEEPVPAEDVTTYARIARETNTPIAGGENYYLANSFRQLLEQGGLDVVCPDVQKCGGIGEAQRIANLANTYHVPFCPHVVATYVGVMAAAHVCASIPNLLLIQMQSYHLDDPSFKETVIYDGEFFSDGHVNLMEKPGIGVDYNVEAMIGRMSERRGGMGNQPFTLTPN